MKLAAETVCQLERCACEKNLVRLPGQLERNLYVKVNAVLEALGGEWSKKLKAHLFPEGADPALLIEDVLLAGEVVTEREKLKEFNFFPTPPGIARNLCRLVKLAPGASVLEPEAGDGGLAGPAAEVVGTEMVTCVEIQPDKAQALRGKGFLAFCDDFLALAPVPEWDFVLMNPPFRNQADLAHVAHAWGFLKEGGVLASVMSAALLFRENRRTREFRERFEPVMSLCEKNPSGSFSVSGTDVETLTVVLGKRG